MQIYWNMYYYKYQPVMPTWKTDKALLVAIKEDFESVLLCEYIMKYVNVYFCVQY